MDGMSIEPLERDQRTETQAVVSAGDHTARHTTTRDFFEVSCPLPAPRGAFFALRDPSLLNTNSLEGLPKYSKPSVRNITTAPHLQHRMEIILY